MSKSNPGFDLERELRRPKPPESAKVESAAAVPPIDPFASDVRADEDPAIAPAAEANDATAPLVSNLPPELEAEPAIRKIVPPYVGEIVVVTCQSVRILHNGPITFSFKPAIVLNARPRTFKEAGEVELLVLDGNSSKRSSIFGFGDGMWARPGDTPPEGSGAAQAAGDGPGEALEWQDVGANLMSRRVA